jgi:hypothetical protein
MQETIHAACLCGTVQLEADLPTERVGHCHCDNCRRAHGAGIWTWATFRPDRVRIVSGADAMTRYVSDTSATRSFCSVCGSTLLYESPRWPDVLDISVANILEDLEAAPSRHAYADRSPGWCPILDDLPRLGGPTGMEPI